MDEELVSVVIPCYNAEEFVGEAIESALQQRYEPKEIIVTDDGSTDESLHEIRSFGERVRWKRTPNRGATAARNEGLKMASGGLVKFLDADDVLADEVLSRQIDELREECGPDEIPFGDVAKMENGTVTRREYDVFEEGDVVSLMGLLKQNIQTSAPLHRRAFLDQVGGFDEELLYQDEHDLHVRLYAAGLRFRYFKGSCCRCRVHDSEGRLSNRDFVAERPDEVRQWIHKRINALREASEESVLPENVRVHFARLFWRYGRRALQTGHEAEAEQYFKDARRVHQRKCVQGSPMYRAGVQVLGPRYSEMASYYLNTLLRN